MAPVDTIGSVAALVVTSSAIATIIGIFLSYFLSKKAREEERRHAKSLRNEEELRALRREEKASQRSQLARLRAVLTELQVNEQILLSWTEQFNWDLGRYPNHPDALRPLATFEFTSFNVAREELNLIPHTVRDSVLRSYARARQFETLTRQVWDAERPDIEALHLDSRATLEATNQAIQSLSTHLMGGTLWEEQLLLELDESHDETHGE